MIDHDKRLNEQRLYEELLLYQEAGIELLLEGHPSCPEEIARAGMIGEEQTYMRDYIQGDSNEIIGIGFNGIKDIE